MAITTRIYAKNGKDVGSLFYVISPSGDYRRATTSNIKNSAGKDLGSYFAPYGYFDHPASPAATGFLIASGKDLNQIYDGVDAWDNCDCDGDDCGD